MDSFGVVSIRLKTIAKKPTLPVVMIADNTNKDETFDFMGAKLKKLNSLSERSATGMDGIRGVLVIAVTPGSAAASFLRPNDVILSLNGRPVNSTRDLVEARLSVIGTATEVIIFRNQRQLRQKIELQMQ